MVKFTENGNTATVSGGAALTKYTNRSSLCIANKRCNSNTNIIISLTFDSGSCESNDSRNTNFTEREKRFFNFSRYSEENNIFWSLSDKCLRCSTRSGVKYNAFWGISSKAFFGCSTLSGIPIVLITIKCWS